jgi:hypothetical protein
MQKIIKHERVELQGSRPATKREVETPLLEPCGRGVNLVRVDGRIEAIEFTCQCGESTIFEIDYEEHGKNEVLP